MSAGSSIALAPAPASAPGRLIAETARIVPRAGDASPDQVEAAYAHCAEIVRTRARNFYHGLRLTPEPRRSAIYSIYAWMRAADDEADTPDATARKHDRLAAFRQRTERVIDGRPPAPDWPQFWTAFAATVWSYPIDPVIFRDMLDGLDEDLDHAVYPTDDALHRYCYRVAGTAGLACVSIWGLRPGADPILARDLALRRGQAFQRTNILRDFAEDFDARPRRVYIPADALAARGLTPDALRAWSNPDACTALIREQALIAREHYRASDPLLTMIDPDCAPTLWAMTRIYSGLLEIIEASPARVVGARRIRLAGLTKASIALRAAVRTRTGGW